MSTSRCRRTSRAINTGSTAVSITARWSRRKRCDGCGGAQVGDDISKRRPRERGDPYGADLRLGDVVEAFCSPDRRWLWVPAFAGTTRRSVDAVLTMVGKRV